MKIENEIFNIFFEKLKKETSVPPFLIERLINLFNSNQLNSYEQILNVISEMSNDDV